MASISASPSNKGYMKTSVLYDTRPPQQRADSNVLKRREWLRRTLWGIASMGGLTACNTVPGSNQLWDRRLRGNTVALLGEVHDNAPLQTQRVRGLQTAIQAGWRPAVVMEQFDTDQQSAIDVARGERPRDVAYLIARASPRTTNGKEAWDWPLYSPLIELALVYDLPLRAANLPRDQARRLVRGGWAEVFSAEQQQALGLSGALSETLQAAQEREVDQGHCGALPAAILPGMARAQMARDAVMAQVLREALLARPGTGVVLIAGNGHVRRDLGVPQWLPELPAEQIWAVGFVEVTPVSGMFDQVVQGEAAVRSDPCAQFKPASVQK
jgi:uncharacterized iron-regulated protein